MRVPVAVSTRCSIYGTVRTKLPLERQDWSFQVGPLLDLHKFCKWLDVYDLFCLASFCGMIGKGWNRSCCCHHWESLGGFRCASWLKNSVCPVWFTMTIIYVMIFRYSPRESQDYLDRIVIVFSDKDWTLSLWQSLHLALFRALSGLSNLSYMHVSA